MEEHLKNSQPDSAEARYQRYRAYRTGESGPSEPKSIFRRVVHWSELRFYQKSDVLYQLTVFFCRRFLHSYVDRTVDQMVQAARSGKQNIIEGSEAGKTSTETEVKLLNVARASIGELRADYLDYLAVHHCEPWKPGSAVFQEIQDFTLGHSLPQDYLPLFAKWSDQCMANIAISLCYQVDAMMNRYLAQVERFFLSEGGIRERMHSLRTGYRQEQDAYVRKLEQQTRELQTQLYAARAQIQLLQKQLKQ